MDGELPDVRASDAERDQIAEILRDAMAEGRLDVDEFGERLDAVYQARTRGELKPLVADLPETSGGRAPDPRPAAGWAARFGGTPTSRSALALMCGFVRRGPWVAPRRFNAVAVWGGGEIDLREARFEDREIVIRATAVMGGVHIVVPHDAEVTVGGVGIMGGFDPSASGTGAPGAVRVSVTGLAFWGGVSVERKAPRGERQPRDGGKGGPHALH
ncbi:DUF1707 domain-containing protein [Streptomyces sp. JJ38]|uniref:DUF1707 SHOCT-like domain-containing protein n=1 Tax=Streptomyces sp. JJ38 TaxID=2738128 RepID=UPI001C58A2B8|nr:DUF1707 domain-containing protein [Streptomyces sp. JJ38]MBW1595995.1 DUF1707 and DUF2154 domain-containing protein [Streptomyces sp. JJ38]